MYRGKESLLTIGIHQPQYLPWLGLLDRVERCDIFVVLDNVPYSKNYFYNRNRIKMSGGPGWLTVPVLTKGHMGQTFVETKIDNAQRWGCKHWKSISYSYAHAPFFKDYSSYLEETLKKDWDLLADLCMDTFAFLLNSYNIRTKVIRSSELYSQGSKEELVINICKELKSTRYLSGPDGKNYLNLDLWDDNGIEVDFQNYIHPVYAQLHGDFVPNMSAIDLLFNCGKDSRDIFSANQPEYFMLRKAL